MKVFISQPMNGQMEQLIREEREKAERWAELYLNKPVILDNMFDEDPPVGVDEGLYFLGKSISLLAEADLVIFCPGWKKARGCKIEWECAANYGIRTVEL